MSFATYQLWLAIEDDSYLWCCGFFPLLDRHPLILVYADPSIFTYPWSPQTRRPELEVSEKLRVPQLLGFRSLLVLWRSIFTCRHKFLRFKQRKVFPYAFSRAVPERRNTPVHFFCSLGTFKPSLWPECVWIYPKGALVTVCKLRVGGNLGVPLESRCCWGSSRLCKHSVEGLSGWVETCAASLWHKL